MFEIILHHEVMKKAISLKKKLSFWSHKYVLSTILSIFDSLETLTLVTITSKPTIDPFFNLVDEPVYRILYFPQRFGIYRNHRFR